MELRPEFNESEYARGCQTFAVDQANSRANSSAIIVLPCGCGKTYAGILQMCQDVQSAPGSNMNFLIISCSPTLLKYWKDELHRITSISNASVVVVDKGDMPIKLSSVQGDVRIFIVSYALLRSPNGDDRDQRTKAIDDGQWRRGTTVKELRSMTYTRVLCDECHHVPGGRTYSVLNTLKKNAPVSMWTGLTASPINSMDRDCVKMIKLMGPQVDGGMSWKAMEHNGYIAPLDLKDVLCPFPSSWYTRYEALLRNKSVPDRCTLMRRMELFNPRKLAYVDSIAQRAMDEGHRIIIFCDCVQLLHEMANVMQCVAIDGRTPDDEREIIFDELRKGTRQMLLVSRIADTGVNLPNVDWAAQVDALGTSARQKTQRVGRVLRFKEGKTAVFWDVITTHHGENTDEEIYLNGRNEFLAQQDYVIEREILPNAMLADARFMRPEVQTRLMDMVNTYPKAKRACKQIHAEYKEALKCIKPPRAVKAGKKQFKETYTRAMNMQKGWVSAYRKQCSQLRFVRNQKLRDAQNGSDLIYMDDFEEDGEEDGALSNDSDES